MAAHSKRWYLQRFKLLSGLAKSQTQLLEQAARMQEVKRGQRIYKPGDPSQHLFLVNSGVIKIAAAGPDDPEVILSFRYPGNVFGESALMDERRRDHLSVAHEDSLICGLNGEVILRLARESPEVGLRIIDMMGRHIRQLQSRISQLSFKSAAGRVARTLVDLSEEYSVRDARGTVIAFRLSQRDLANLAGLTRETVNMILHDFQRRGLAEADRRVIRLLDSQKLRAVR